MLNLFKLLNYNCEVPWFGGHWFAGRVGGGEGGDPGGRRGLVGGSGGRDGCRNGWHGRGLVREEGCVKKERWVR